MVSSYKESRNRLKKKYAFRTYVPSYVSSLIRRYELKKIVITRGKSMCLLFLGAVSEHIFLKFVFKAAYRYRDINFNRKTQIT